MKRDTLIFMLTALCIFPFPIVWFLSLAIYQLCVTLCQAGGQEIQLFGCFSLLSACRPADVTKFLIDAIKGIDRSKHLRPAQGQSRRQGRGGFELEIVEQQTNEAQSGKLFVFQSLSRDKPFQSGDNGNQVFKGHRWGHNVSLLWKC